jgi:plastocyanin
MRHDARIVTFVTVLGLTLAGGTPAVLAVEPGVDIAVPRVAIVVANGGTLRFVPPTVAVEQGDYVRWTWTTGAHTTTSGAACVSNALWASNLNSTTTQFTRQFLEAPGARPYFCAPHCGLGMTGSVLVTPLIDLTTTDAGGGAISLSWAGGVGTYRIFRSSSPLFFTDSTTELTPAGGITQASFLDQLAGVPPEGEAFFYLVMNHF